VAEAYPDNVVLRPAFVALSSGRNERTEELKVLARRGLGRGGGLGLVLALVLTSTGHIATAQDRAATVQQASVAAPAPREICLQSGSQPPARLVEACGAALASGQLAGRDLGRAYLARAQAYAAQGDGARATADNRAAVRAFDAIEDPDVPDPGLLFLRATAYHALGEADAALDDYNRSIRLSPFYALAFLDRGILLSTYKQQYDLALMDFDRAIALAPKLSAAYTNRCRVRGIVGRDLEGALADCDTAISQTPTAAGPRETRGFVDLRMGNADAALADYDAALGLASDRPLALYGRALAFKMKGDIAKADADRGAATALDPAVAQQFSRYGLN